MRDLIFNGGRDDLITRALRVLDALGKRFYSPVGGRVVSDSFENDRISIGHAPSYFAVKLIGGREPVQVYFLNKDSGAEEIADYGPFQEAMQEIDRLLLLDDLSRL